jgi:hypothetical protein
LISVPEDATFDDGRVDNRPVPLITGMTIADALTPARIVMHDSRVQALNIPRSTFAVGNMP